MHYTGTIWRPPYEAGSLLLEVTAGCTWHRCKFCTLYGELPFRFRMTPPETVEADLREAQMLAHDPMGKLTAHLQGLPEPGSVRRVFLTGANPFALSFGRLRQIAELIAHYLPACETIGCFARVTDVARKTDGELEALRGLGYAGLSIGVETGDGPSLEFMDKGYGPGDIVEQSRRLDGAGIAYHFMYLAGLPGAGRGMEGAVNSAEIFNRTHPRIIGSSMLTVFPESRLHEEMRRGTWTEESEIEKLEGRAPAQPGVRLRPRRGAGGDPDAGEAAGDPRLVCHPGGLQRRVGPGGTSRRPGGDAGSIGSRLRPGP